MKTPGCLTYRNIRHGCIFGGQFEFHASRPRDNATAARNRLADDTSYICCYRECMLTTHSILTPVHLLKDVRLSNYWMHVHVLSTLCDVISFNGQGQLCPLTCAEWRDLSNHTRMSTIQSRTPEKEAKNHVTLTWKSPWKSCSIAHLPFLSPNPKILKAFLKTIPTKMKPTKCPAREKKNEARKAKKEGRRESEK